jgi:predicted peroxiredoxin
MGNAALAMDTKVVLILQSAGVGIATRGIQEHIFASGFDPAAKLLGTFLEFGGQLLVCIPCLESRKIATDTLVPGALPVKAGHVVQEIGEARSVVSY